MITLEKKNYGGIIKAPSSKSDGHRALICAALAREGTSIISNVYFSNDIIATMKSLESLGASFEIKKVGWAPRAQATLVRFMGWAFRARPY